MKKFNKILIFVMLIAILATCFVGCAPSNKKLIEKVDKEITATNGIDVALGSYTLPTLSKELTKDGAKLEITVKDSMGSSVEVKDGKFEIKAGGEYVISIVVKNKKDKVLVEKSYSVTDNAVLRAQLTDAEVGELIAKRNDLLTKAAAAQNIDYAKFSNLPSEDKLNIANDTSTIIMLETILCDSLFKSGLSKNTLNSVLNGVGSFVAQRQDTNGKQEGITPSVDVADEENPMPNIIKDLISNALAPIFSGGESPIAVASILYDMLLSSSETSLDETKADYDFMKSISDTVASVAAMTEADVAKFLKTIQTDTIAEVTAFNTANAAKGDSAYAVALYGLLEKYALAPVLDADSVVVLFAHVGLKAKVLAIKNDTSNAKLFNIIAGAKLFNSPQYKNIAIKEGRLENDVISTRALSAYKVGFLPREFASNVNDVIEGIQRCSNNFLTGLMNATEDLSKNATNFKRSIATCGSEAGSSDIVKAAYDAQKVSLDEMVASKAEMIETFTMATKVAGVVSPIINSNYAKEMMVMTICAQVEIPYKPSFMNPETGAITVNSADVLAILTAVNGEITKFVTKYGTVIDNFENTFINKFLVSLTKTGDESQDAADKIDGAAIAALVNKYVNVVKPLFASVQDVIAMVDASTIDFFASIANDYFTNPDGTLTGDKAELMMFAEYTAMSVMIKNVIDTSKGALTIGDYLAAIKADILANEKLLILFVPKTGEDQPNIPQRALSPADIEMAKEAVGLILGQVEAVYTRAVDTLALTGNKILIALPTDEEKLAEFREIKAMWDELMASFA